MKELKARLIAFLGDLDTDNMPPEMTAEAGELYRLLTRPRGRQKGYRKNVLTTPS